MDGTKGYLAWTSPTALSVAAHGLAFAALLWNPWATQTGSGPGTQVLTVRTVLQPIAPAPSQDQDDAAEIPAIAPVKEPPKPSPVRTPAKRQAKAKAIDAPSKANQAPNPVTPAQVGGGSAGDGATSVGKADLTSRARLVRTSFRIPTYTRAALRARYETTVVAKVQIAANGLVKDVELEKDIPFGMGSRILTAIRRAEYVPEKNRLGHPIEGWTTLRFKLEIR